MSFHEKSAIAISGSLVLVFGAYFALVGSWLSTTAADEIRYQPLMIIAIIPLTILAIVTHVVLAVLDPKGANAYDERDKVIAWRSERVGGYVLAVGVFAGLVLAMAEFPQFFIAHALLLAWVLAEITDNALKVWRYRRGA